MAKTTGPAFSLDASGTLAGAMTFSKWKGRNYVRLCVTPRNPKTESQMSQRLTMSAAVATWKDAACVDSQTKQQWGEAASGTSMSGFNKYVKAFITANPQKTAPWTIPTL